MVRLLIRYVLMIVYGVEVYVVCIMIYCVFFFNDGAPNKVMFFTWCIFNLLQNGIGGHVQPTICTNSTKNITSRYIPT